jgi:uncharacterized protein
MEEKVFFDNGKGDQLCGIISNSTGNKNNPIIVLCHGFTTQKNNSTNLALTKILNNEGINTLRFDFFGHGESKGKFENITVSEGANDILQAISFLKKEGYSEIGLFGSSFGGISSLIAASKTDDLFVLALKAPVSDYKSKRKITMGEEKIQKWKEDGFYIHVNTKGTKFRLNYTFYEDFDNNLVYDVADKIKVPTIIIHGDKDKAVPVNQSKKTALLISDCQLEIVSGADHRFSKKADFEKMLKLISGFIIKNKLKK